MLADGAPSSCEASQTIQRAASTVAVILAEGGGPDEVADAARAERGLVLDDQPAVIDAGDP